MKLLDSRNGEEKVPLGNEGHLDREGRALARVGKFKGSGGAGQPTNHDLMILSGVVLP